MKERFLNFINNKNFFYYFILFSGSITFVFCNFPYLFNSQNFFFGINQNSIAELDIFSVWLPLAIQVSQGNLFPINTNVSGETSALVFYPYLTIWVFGFFIYLFGLKLSLLLGQVLFSIISFYLLIKIYMRFLPSLLWCFALTSLGLFLFTSIDFREFLIGVFNSSNLSELVKFNKPDIMNFPIPGFTLSFFLFAFYYTFRIQTLNSSKFIFMTILWSSQIYVHLVNGIFGLSLWYSLLIIWLFKKPNLSIKLFVRLVTISICILIPAILGFKNSLFLNEGIGHYLKSYTPEEKFNFYYFFVYFVFPVLSMVILYFIKRIDKDEILIKFWPIYLCLFLEFFLTSTKLLFGIGFPIDLLSSRLSGFFLHIFYYVPIIYFLSHDTFEYKRGVESSKVSTYFLKILHWFFTKGSKVYLPIFIFLLFFKVIISSKNHLEHNKKLVENYNSPNQEYLNMLLNNIEENQTVVIGKPSMNIMLPLYGNYKTLWVNKFTNFVSTDEIVERFALWVHLTSGDINDFFNIMEPTAISILSRKTLFLDKENGFKSIGYRFATEQKFIKSDYERITFKKNIKEIYENLDVDKAIKKYNVLKIVTKHNTPLQYGYNIHIENNYGNIYLREQ